MLQNQSFETVSLQEELEAAQTELFVLESVNVLNEAEDAAAGEEQGSSKLKEYSNKAKEFFIKIAKAIAEAAKKFMAFFVEAFRKLQSRAVNVRKYIVSVKSTAKGSLETPKEVSYLDGAALDFISEADPESSNYEQAIKNAEGYAKGDEKLVKITINNINDASKAASGAEKSVASIKKAAKAVDSLNKKAQKIAKDGVTAAAKGDKEGTSDKKGKMSNASKAHSVGRTAVSRATKLANQTLAAAFSAAKELNKAGKKSDKKSSKEEKKS